MTACPFATLVTDEPELRIAHVPIQLHVGVEVDEVIGHVAAADPFADSLRERSRLLVVIQGPSLYVSPKWHADQGLPTYTFALSISTAAPSRGTSPRP